MLLIHKSAPVIFDKINVSAGMNYVLLQPVCKVHTWTDDSTDVSEDKGTSIYKSSYKRDLHPENRQLVTSRDKETTAHGIGEWKRTTTPC